jgi:hypothetical protein
MAFSRASKARSARRLVLARQPTMRRENRWVTKAR